MKIWRFPTRSLKRSQMMLQNEEPSNANWLVPVMVQGV